MKSGISHQTVTARWRRQSRVGKPVYTARLALGADLCLERVQIVVDNDSALLGAAPLLY